MRKRLLTLPFLLALAALVLAACGSGSGDESKVEEAIEIAATSTDPSKCTEVETKAFVEQSTQEAGAAAVKSCEKEAKAGEGVAKSVEISKVEVDGSDATAEAALTGGVFGGQTLDIALVEEDGQWKVNELTRFAKFDKGKLVHAFETQLTESPGGVNGSFASCVIEDLEESSQQEIEELLWDPSSGGFEALARKCS